MSADTKSLRARLFDVVPAASFQMEKLLGLVDIVLSDAVPTAAVECSFAPRMLLNPQFVEQYCQRDGHLLMLVMHELQHIILGHTRLFPRVTPAHNLAFDAVINAMLCKQFPSEAGFFQATNGWDTFPGRLLRPAPGWPTAPEPMGDDASDREREVHDLLYEKDGQQVTYHELFELLVTEFETRAKQTAGAGQTGAEQTGAEQTGAEQTASAEQTAGARQTAGQAACPEQVAGDAVLLGDHGGPSGAGSFDEQATRDETTRSVLRRVVEDWPSPDQPLGGRDAGRSQKNWILEPIRSPREALRKALRRLLARAGVGGRAARARHRRRRVETTIRVGTVRPQARDRRAHAWTRLHGMPPLLWRGWAKRTQRLMRPQPVAHVYLDISGSMDAALPTLAAALREPHRAGAIRLFVFSTVIDEAQPGDLAKQRFANTRGTNIRCVLDHLETFSAQHRPRRVVLLTDGYVGTVDPDELQRLRVSLFVGHYAAYGAQSAHDLAKVARHIEVLPTLPGAE